VSSLSFEKVSRRRAVERAAPGASPGERRVTQRPRLADVAAHVGLSTASVSLVLRGLPGPSEETRQRVLAAVEALGYRPDRTASSLARLRSGLLGVLADMHNSFHAELLDDIDAAARAAGYDVVLSPLTRVRDEARAVETLVDFRCEALILLGPETPPRQLAELDATLPAVVVGRRLAPLVTDVVRSADTSGVGQAVDHLADLGHRRIVFVDGGRGTIATDRRRGYRAAMRRRGLAADARVLPGDHTEAAGIRAAQVLLEERELPTAVVAFNDRCAVGLLDALSRARVPVPDQVSVVGYDDSPQSRWAHIELTGRKEPREVVLTPRLVVRATTGPPPTPGAAA
jgi:DNA-binding LacI/PurR family transcriptional regulator